MTTVFQFLVFLSFAGLHMIPQWLLVIIIILSILSALDYIYLFVKNNFYRGMRNA
ncbi:hypothetical protein SAMN05421690_100498 [Nitrosomonas sp. Nm51]|nr:hypothetical protein SAMN05421690_100498 [Nitrosomonas sp. Nm51]